MREIKFRVWCNHFNETTKKYELRSHIEEFSDDLLWQKFTGLARIGRDQYTGRKDTNKKDAYHNDIVETKVGIGTIEWDYQYCCWEIKYKCMNDSDLLDIEFEIIGNKYENPELVNNNECIKSIDNMMIDINTNNVIQNDLLNI